LKLPEDFKELSNSNKDEFRKFRYDVSDTLMDVAKCVGYEACLQKMSMALANLQSLSQSGGVMQWQDIEAILFAVRAIGKFVPATESNLMPKIMGMLPQMPSEPEVQYSAILVISRYVPPPPLLSSFIHVLPSFLYTRPSFLPPFP
jgi:transportin-3